MLESAYIGLGSNLDNPLSQVKSAIKELSVCKDITLDAVSSIYKSKPLKITTANEKEVEQPDYINAVVRINTHLAPLELLDVLQNIEKKHKRVTEYRWGPRSLDLDILLYSDLVLTSERLTIPHKELTQRDFVVYPLNDIAPELDIPMHGKLENILLTISNENLVFVERCTDVTGLIL